MHLIVKNLQLRFKKSSHKMTSQNQSVPTLCCPPTTTSYQEGLDSPAVTAGLWDSRGSGSSHTPWMGKLRTPYSQLREMGQEPAWPRFPLHHSSGHHSSPITKKLRKDNLDVFIVLLFTNHKAGQKQSVNTGREHRIHSSNSTGAGPGPLCSEGDVVQQNGSYFWEQACPTRNYIHLSTKARIASNCGKAKRTEVAQV